MKILVTGGAGFIGSHLCERLLAQEHRVLCLDNFNDYYDPHLKEANLQNSAKRSSFALLRGDILDPAALKQTFAHPLFGHEPPEVVVHLAALAGVSPSLTLPATYVDVDVRGTVLLLEQARIHGVSRFVFGSSSSVYGVNAKVPFAEEDPTDLQVSPYAVAKRAAELYCMTYHRLYQLPVTILRFFTVYGPRQRPEMAIHAFTRLLSEGKAVPIYGDGRSARDYTYVDDITNGILAAIECDYPLEIFNLGNSSPTKLLDLVGVIAESLNVSANLEMRPNQPGDVPITYADLTKAEKMLRYQPRVAIEEGVRRFVEWFQSP